MRDNYDFSKAVKNPFSSRKKGEYIVKIYYNFNKDNQNETNTIKTSNNDSVIINSSSKHNNNA